MALNVEGLLHHRFEDIRHQYGARDSILYALGLGLGSDPLDEEGLDYLIETRLRVLPAMAVTLASPGMWVRDPALGIDWVRLVHSAQIGVFHRPLPASGKIIGRARIASLHDRGQERGAVLTVEREIIDEASGELYASLRQTLLLRGDGGFGGPPAPKDDPVTIPQRAPDYRISMPVSKRAALIYRLSGDWNPIHADPKAARAAGFDRPILHGLASYGIACLAICKALRVSPGSLVELSVRFSGIVYPGDVFDFSIWEEQRHIVFEAHVNGRVVLSRGHAKLGGVA